MASIANCLQAGIVAGTFLIVAAAPTFSQTPPAGQAAPQRSQDDDRGLWGLAGLLGLAGLAGLMRRRDRDDRPDATRRL